VVIIPTSDCKLYYKALRMHNMYVTVYVTYCCHLIQSDLFLLQEQSLQRNQE